MNQLFLHMVKNDKLGATNAKGSNLLICFSAVPTGGAGEASCPLWVAKLTGSLYHTQKQNRRPPNIDCLSVEIGSVG